MGIPWLGEILSWSLLELNKPPPFWTDVVEIFTIIQPTFVFLLIFWTDVNKEYFGSKYKAVKGKTTGNYHQIVDGSG